MSGTSTFHIDGMTCGRCVEAVRVKVAAVAGVAAAGYTLA
ncbi:cation transporter [Catellatospora sp. TT07R-123]|nr:cation transporter [Catellatospora sp. TT07R-123]